MIDNLAKGVQSFTSNVFYVGGERPVIVDPGAGFDVVETIGDRPDPEAVVLTHTHPDHVGNLDQLKDAYGIEAWGFDASYEGVDHALADDEHVRIGDHEFQALHTPGHATDHLCLYAEQAGVLFAGDLVFQNGGFGRTDLPGADHATLIESIERLRATVSEDLREMHVGHGPSVTNEPSGHIDLALRAARMASGQA